MGGVLRKIGADPLGLTKEGGLLGKPKTVEPPSPPVSAPLATPEVGEEAEELAKRRQLRKKGRRKTIITGALVPEETGKKRFLG